MTEAVELGIRLHKRDDGQWTVDEVRRVPDETPKPKVSREQYRLSRAGLMSAVFQALLLVNGAGAAILLNFLKEVTSTTGKADYGHIAFPAAQGAMAMALGLLLAVLSGGARFQHSVEAEYVEYGDKGANEARRQRWKGIYVGLMIASALLFVVGVALVGLPTLDILRLRLWPGGCLAAR